MKERLANCTEWDEFPARGTCVPTLGGIGNVDDNIPEWQGHEGYIGQSFRFFDLEKRVWSIYWADNITGVLGAPVYGTFSDGTGEFYGEDEHEATPVRVRFRWTGITESGAHWEQAFSADRAKPGKPTGPWRSPGSEYTIVFHQNLAHVQVLSI